MIKKIFLFSVFFFQFGSAYGAEVNIQQIVKVANEYMASISGGYTSKPSKVIRIKGSPLGEYGVIYMGMPVESSIGAAGGNYGMDFVDVKDAGFSYYVEPKKSTPNIIFSSWPIVKYINQSGKNLAVEVSKYGPEDKEACMSDIYRETLVREKSGNWKAINSTLLKNDACKELE